MFSRQLNNFRTNTLIRLAVKSFTMLVTLVQVYR